MKNSLTAFTMAAVIIVAPSYPTALADQSLASVNFDEKRRQFNSRAKQQADSIKEKQSSFSRRIQKQQKEFSNIISQRWKSFSVKPAKLNPYRFKPKPQNIKPLPQPQDEITPRQSPSPFKPFIPQRSPTSPTKTPPDSSSFDVNLWGNRVEKIAVPKSLIRHAITESIVDENAVRGYWRATNTDSLQLMRQVNHIKTTLRLNDWGTVLLLQKIAAAIFPDKAAARNLLIWQLATDLGLDTRLALSDGRPVLLFASTQIIYEIPRLLIDGRAYYLVALPNEKPAPIMQKLKTYPQTRSAIVNTIDLKMFQAPLISDAGKMETKSLHFSFGGKKFTLKIPVNRAMLAYLKTFPLAEFQVFVDSPLAPEAETALRTQLSPIIEELKKKDPIIAINFLLRFVQLAFKYESDTQRIGKEDYFFGQETLLEPVSDCEDRVALFAWLTTNLLKIQTVAIYWPGHLSAAVLLPNSNLKGVQFRGKHYVFADPTFINANIGRAVPPFENQKPHKIIPISH